MTRVDLGLLALDVLYLAAGYAFVGAIGLARFRPADVRFVGLSYLVGWALMGTLLSLAAMAGIPVTEPTVAVTAALVAGAAAAVRWRRPGEVPRSERRRRNAPATVVTLVAGAVIGLSGAAAIVTALKSEWTPEFDLLTVWLPRAQIVYYLHQLDPAQWASFIDPWYPPLVPVVFGATFEFAGGFHPSVLPIQETLLGLAFILSLLALLGRYVPRWISWPALALLMVTPFFWWRLQSLMPDATLSYMVVAAATVIVMWLYEPQGAWLALGVVFLAAATLAKLEGLVFAGGLVLVMLVAAAVLHGRRARPALVLLLGPAAAIPWRIWLDTHAVAATNADFNQPDLLSPSFLASRAGGFAHALNLILRAPWGPAFRATEAFIIVGTLVVVCVIRRIPVITVAAVVWFTLMILALALTYATSRVAIDPYFAFSGPRVGGLFVVALAALTPLLLGIALQAPWRRGRPP